MSRALVDNNYISLQSDTAPGQHIGFLPHTGELKPASKTPRDDEDGQFVVIVEQNVKIIYDEVVYNYYVCFAGTCTSAHPFWC